MPSLLNMPSLEPKINIDASQRRAGY